MLTFHENQLKYLTKDHLFECCYEKDHAMEGYMSWINSQSGDIVKIGQFNDSDLKT